MNIIIHYYTAQSFGNNIVIIQVNRMLSLTYDYSVDLHNSLQMADVVLLVTTDVSDVTVSPKTFE